MFPYLNEEMDAVHTWHLIIGDDGIEFFLFKQLERFGTPTAFVTEKSPCYYQNNFLISRSEGSSST
jgi:hypothetical protein